MSQKGKVALVTGGASGIGRSFVEALLDEGAYVTVGDLGEEVGEEVLARYSKKYPGKVNFKTCNVTKRDEIEECIRETISKFKGLDIIINNAGVATEWIKPVDDIIDINITAVVHGTKLGLNYMSEKTGGRGGIIVNIASITSFEAFPSIPIYSATKAFVNQFSRSYGHELFYKDSKVKVFAINPGMTKTNMTMGTKALLPNPDISKNFYQHFGEYPLQEPANLGKGLIVLLKNAENGSLWTIENNEPPKPTDLSKPAIKNNQ